MTTESQNDLILKDLRAGMTLDPLLVLRRHNSWNLRSRISEIEGKSGHVRMLVGDELIARGWATTTEGKRHRTYSLVNSKTAAEWDRMRVKA